MHPIKAALTSGISFGFLIGILFGLQQDYQHGIKMGIPCGIIFGVFIGIFVKFQKQKSQKERPLAEDEKLLKEGAMSHFKNIENVGGWVYLTDKRLFFKSHFFNIQKHELSIPLDQISEVKACMTFAIIPNGLKIITVDGTKERFTCYGRKEWEDEITNAKRDYSSS